jgi:predicted nucleic acid-binding protein
LIAFADRSDSYHPVFRRLFESPPPLLTSTLVIAEGQGWFLKRYDRSRALSFLTMIEEMGFLEVVAIGPPEIEKATQLIRRFSDQDLTLADASGLHLMQERRIRVCWSTDFHLSLGGAGLVTHQQ